MVKIEHIAHNVSEYWDIPKSFSFAKGLLLEKDLETKIIATQVAFNHVLVVGSAKRRGRVVHQPGLFLFVFHFDTFTYILA